MRTLALPTGRIPRLLYGLCRRGPALAPARTVDGWDVVDVAGLEEGRFQLALPSPAKPIPGDPTPPDPAVAWLRRAASDDGALVELAVALALLLELDGLRALWRWQRAIEVLHGAAARPDRHNDPIQQLLDLFQRARVSFEPDCSTSPSTWPQLVVLERSSRSSATVRLDSAFRRELAAVTYAAPAESFLIGPPVRPDPNKPGVVGKVLNPEGNLPSRRTRARARVSLMLKIAPRRPGQQPRTQLATELEQLMADGGSDVERVKRRRHLQPWGLALKDELERAGRALGVGVIWFREQLGSILRTVVHVGRSATTGRAPAAEGVPVASSASRAPP